MKPEHTTEQPDAEPDLLAGSTGENTGGTTVCQEPEEAVDEFERLLNGFLESEQIENEASSPTVSIKACCIDYNHHEYADGLPQPRTRFRTTEGKYLHLSVTLHNHQWRQESWDYSLTAEIQNSRGDMLAFAPLIGTVHPQEIEQKITRTFTGLKLAKGCYRLRIMQDDGLLETRQITLVDLPDCCHACIEFKTFGLYRGNSGWGGDVENQNTQNAFRQAGLESIHAGLTVADLRHESHNYEFIVSLYDEQGRLKERAVCDDFRTGPEGMLQFWQAFGSQKAHYWLAGYYYLEISFFGEQVVYAGFEVGETDIESVYSRESVQPKIRLGNRAVIRSVSKPIEQLDRMIGLSTLKEKLKTYLCTIEFNRQRARQGLPVKKAPLHAVFTGNPGTGKTTVAKLMGQIFKEMGLLSKGHVVLAERTTLTGQFYNSENEKTLNLLTQAKGGILFIDEAYTLYAKNDPKDPGIRVLEALLTALSDESDRDWMLIMAGYPQPMSDMLNANPGLATRVPNSYPFDDYDLGELMQIADLYVGSNGFRFSDDAYKTLEMVVRKAWSNRDERFGNGRYVTTLLETEIIPNMSKRIMGHKQLPDDLSTIEKSDIPVPETKEIGRAMEKLNEMVGLSTLKGRIEDHIDYVRFINARRDQGIYTSAPPLNMIFTGNPGTGKTTVADMIGEIYASMGLLSRGDVIPADRMALVGSYPGDTEIKMKSLLQAAAGNVLFIDEAYTLGYDAQGRLALEILMTALSKENVDMIVIMAGYTDQMNELLSINPGLDSRFPYTFEFEDYSTDELLLIADLVATREQFRFTAEAREALRTLVVREQHRQASRFGNASFIIRLILAEVIPQMSSRLAKLPPACLTDKEILQTIEKEDIPIKMGGAELANGQPFDEAMIAGALARLDKMVGLKQIKQSIHDFVDVARYLNGQGKAFTGGSPLKWSFAGNTGTGKSCVAEILAGILTGMHLLGKGHVVELRAEELYTVNDLRVDEMLKEAMKSSQQGLLFIDGDAPMFKNADSRLNSEKLRIKLTANTAELPGNYALIIAEYESPRQPLVQSLARQGVTFVDHTFLFEDYSQEELLQILEQQLEHYDLRMDQAAAQTLYRYIGGLCGDRELEYANARTMKILARSIAKIVALRESRSSGCDKGAVLAADVASFVWQGLPRAGYKKVGYTR